MGPVVPFLSDSPAQLDEAVRQIAATGAGHVSPIVLHLRPGTREWFFTWLQARHPGLTGRYLELYGRGAYAPKAYQNRIAGQVRELAEKYGVGRPRPGFRRITPARPAAGRPGMAPGPQATVAASPVSAAGSLTASEHPSPRPPGEPPRVRAVSGVPRVPAPPEQLTLL